MGLYHAYDEVENSNTGVPMAGVRVVPVFPNTGDGGSGVAAPIYADESSTPFVPANTCVTDATGMYSFYIEPGSYNLDFFIGSKFIRRIADVQFIDPIPTNVEEPYRATLSEAINEFPIGFYFRSDDKNAEGPYPLDMWIYQRIGLAPYYLPLVSNTASMAELNAAVSEAEAAATNAINYGNAAIRSGFVAADAESWTAGAWVQVLSSDTGTHASKTGDFGASGGQTPNSGVFQEDATLGLVRKAATVDVDAKAAATLAQAWSESTTAPDGGGGKSSKTWAGEAATSAASAQASMSSLYISGIEAIGRPTGATLVDGTASNTQPFYFQTAATKSGTLASVDLYDKTAGSGEVAVYRLISGTWTLQGTRAITLTGGGSRNVPLASSIAVVAGDVMAIRGITGAFTYNPSTAADGAGYFHGTAGAFPSTVVFGTIQTNLRWNVRFNINWSEQNVTGPNFAALGTRVDGVAAVADANTSTLGQITQSSAYVIGRTTLTSTGQTSANNQQIHFLDYVPYKGTLDNFVLPSNATGTVVAAIYRLVASVWTLQPSLTRSFTVTATGVENTYTMGVNVEAGDMLAVVGSATGVLTYSAGVIGSGEWHGGTGTTFPSTVTPGSATSIYIQIKWNLSHVIAKVSAESTAALVAQLAPRNAPIASNLPVVTDGRALYAWKGKLAQYRYAGTGLLRVVMTGDSWHEYYRIPQAMANLLYAATAKAGDGWISINVINANNLQALNGITQSKSNWTYYDASTNTAPPASGCGWDGQAIYTTGTTATITTANVVCTEFRIYYYKGTGSFRYQVDGGAWTTVTPDGSGTLGVVAITGLSNSAHSIVIDTSVNSGAGTVSLYGFYAKTAAAGVEVMKAGNASATGQHYSLFADTYIAPIATVLPPDVVIVALGTNDYRTSGATPATLITALGKIVTAYRAANANCGFIFIAPAQTNSGVVLPLSQYRDAIYQFCIANGHEFYNMYDEWSTWAIENAAGQFLDTLHPGDWGSYRLTARVKSQLLDF